MRMHTVLFSVALFALLTVPASAQVATGTPPFGSFAGTPDVVNLANLNGMIAIPIRTKAGRGLPFNYTLTYNSAVWYPVASGSSHVWTPVTNFGWTASGQGAAGYLNATLGGLTDCIENNRPVPFYWTYTNFIYHDIYGEAHSFPDSDIYIVNTTCSGGVSGWGSLNELSSDGSGYTVMLSGSNESITAPSGSTFHVSGVRSFPAGTGTNVDANGNEITIGSGTFTDTLGTTVLTTAGSGTPSSPVTFTYPAPSGGNATYTEKFTAFTVRTNFGCSGIGEYGANGTTTADLVSEIDLPDGSKYLFTYEPTPGFSGDVTGRLASVTLPTGGTISYAYSGGSNGIVCSDGSTATLTRTTPDGTWQYAHSESGTAWTTTITDPQNNQTVLNFQGIYETEREIYQGAATGTPLKTVNTCYNGAATPCNSTAITLPITQQARTIQWPSGLESKTVTSYNSYGLVTERDEYDYGGVSPVRKTLISYASLGNGIVDRPSSVSVEDGTGTVKSRTTYCYDEGTPSGTTTCNTAGTPAGLSGTPQHVSISGSRGNATTIAQLVSGSTYLGKKFTYYDTGKVDVATDVNGAQTTYNYSNATVTCGNAFPSGVSEAISPLSKSFTWSCNGGVQLTATDENGQTVTTNYTSADFWRPDSVQDQMSPPNTTNLTYNGQTSVESTLNFSSSTTDVLATLDGLGRPLISQRKQSPSSGAYDSVETTYGPLGRAIAVTLPYSASAGAACSGTCPGTTTTYDALGRPLTATDSGGLNTTYQYNANDVLETVGPAPSGENPKQKQYEYDALGRLTSVCEITNASGSGPCPQTHTGENGYFTQYTYDALGDLTGVSQSGQSRYYLYDGLRRMTSETNPESGVTSYSWDSDSTMCGNGAYTSNGDLVKTTDADGNCVMRYYDALHRLTDVGNNHYSATNPCKRFRYDNSTGVLGSRPSGVTSSNGNSRLTEAETDTCAWPVTQSSIVTDEWFSYDARGETTDKWQSTPLSGGYYHANETYWPNGAPKQLTGIVSLPTFSYGLDGEGRINTVSSSAGQNPVTSATYYQGSGLVNTVTLGSGDNDSFQYDANTNRMKQYQFSINSQNYTGVLTWNANGSLATQNITDPFNAADTQNCSYVHDDLGRIGSDSLTTPGVNCVNGSQTTWSQIFGYDLFGNLTKDGTESFQPDYSESTNHMIPYGSCTPSYDADGNVLNDCLNTYSWDAYGRPTTVDGATVTYDAFGNLVDVNYPWEVFYTPAGDKIQFVGQLARAAFINLPGGVRAEYDESQNQSGGGLLYYEHRDYEGNGRLLSTPSRTFGSSMAYGPFGELYAQSSFGAGDFTGIGQIFSNSVYDFPAREYGIQGRWPSPDPAGLAAVNPMDPQTWNRYAYVRNSPLSITDPTGLAGVDLPGPFQDPKDPIGSGCTVNVDGLDVPCGMAAQEGLGGGWGAWDTLGAVAEPCGAECAYEDQILYGFHPQDGTDPCIYLNDAGTGIESVDQNSSPGECRSTGGSWLNPGQGFVIANGSVVPLNPVDCSVESAAAMAAQPGVAPNGQDVLDTIYGGIGGFVTGGTTAAVAGGAAVGLVSQSAGHLMQRGGAGALTLNWCNATQGIFTWPFD